MFRALLVFLAFSQVVHAQGYGRVVYWSPDDVLQAIVIPSHNEEPYFSEHSVEIRSKAGALLAKEDYSSSDHEHGRCVLKAGWSPDSNFFAYSTTSSGGHSVWHVSTFAFDRKQKKIYYLDELVGGSLVEKDFYFSSPAIFHSKRNNWQDEKQISEDAIPVDVDLNTIDFK
jgi:dipeptidyl aminopeptidase/acylaminoacyl peptidase